MSRIELSSVLRAHSIAVNDAHVDAALQDPEIGPELAEWVQTHLTTDTLLTLDELDLYDALRRSGRDEELAAAVAPEGGSKGGLPLTDAELRAATAALETSTASIKKQTDVLRQQQEAVARLFSTTSQNNRDSRAAFEARHRKQWDSNRADLAMTVESLARNLDLRVDELSQQNKELAQRVQQTVEGLCRSDGKLLASLQKLGWALPVTVSTTTDAKQQDEDEQRQQRAISRLRDICLHLIKFTVETIRTKLDRLYIEALEAAQAEQTRIHRSDDTDDDDVSALQEELESLYSEILPVAQMSVEQQYLEPALKSLSGKNGRNLTRSLLALDYIDECLEFLVEHIELLTIRIETAAAHHATAETFIATARNELAVPVPAATPSSAAQRHQKRLSNYGSPARRRMSSSVGGSHMRTMSGGGALGAGAGAGAGASSGGGGSKGLRRRSSGFGSGLANVPPIDQLLESLSILLPEDSSAPTEGIDTTAVNAKFLHATLAERQAKADGVAANAQESFEATSASHMADARRAVWMARESVLGESPYGQVQLIDPEIDGSIVVMTQEVERLRAHLQHIDKDVDEARRVRSAKREQIISRWGG